jgi:transcriptional regulator with AAA-type ATPase domain
VTQRAELRQASRFSVLKVNTPFVRSRRPAPRAHYFKDVLKVCGTRTNYKILLQRRYYSAEKRSEVNQSEATKQPEQQGSSVSEQGQQVPAAVTNSSELPSPAPRITLRHLRVETEIHAISEALEETGWNRKRAAKLLSISYRGLLYKIRQHNITPPKNSELTPLAQR